MNGVAGGRTGGCIARVHDVHMHAIASKGLLCVTRFYFSVMRWHVPGALIATDGAVELVIE